jgi:hypothetical protein
MRGTITVKRIARKLKMIKPNGYERNDDDVCSASSNG